MNSNTIRNTIKSILEENTSAIARTSAISEFIKKNPEAIETAILMLVKHTETETTRQVANEFSSKAQALVSWTKNFQI